MRFYGMLEKRRNGHYEEKAVTILEGMKQFENFNVAKNLSIHTLRHYKDILNAFKEFYECNQLCSTLTENIIFEYTAYLRKRQFERHFH